MFKTKLEVDRHVDNCMKKINNETERNLRCFSFAKLYFNVCEYEQACRYVSSYLSVKPKSAEGHQFLGKCLEKLGKKEAALEAYRNSLQIDSKQNNLVMKICELLSSDDVSMDQSGARYFCDLAQSFDPNNPAVYSLKERLITTDSDNPVEVSELLLNELESRPTDVNFRIRLLKHFLENNLIKEAFKHASAIEEKDLSIFHNSLSWYETFAEVLVRLQRDLSFSSQLTWEFWFLSVSVLDRLTALSLDEHSDNLKSSIEYITTIFNFDQMISKASQNISGCSDPQLVSAFLTHYHAQLYFHIATLIFKQAKKGMIQFKEATNVALPVLFSAYHTTPPDLQSMWLMHSSETTRKLVQNWHKSASFRCSQTGHILLAAAKDKKSKVIAKAIQYSTGMWREKIFKKLFVQRDQHLKMSTSYFVSCSHPLEPSIRLPDTADLLKYDEVAQLVYPDSLHHYIWISLNSNLPDLNIYTFEGLQYSSKNLNNCAAEALSLLDVQAFIYCAMLCAKSKYEDDSHMLYYIQDKPSVLPASLTENLGTLNQSKFITAAYKMYKKESDFNMGDLKLLLIKGIEVIRCIGHHGLDVKLLVDLADIFEERVKNLTKQSEIEFNTSRAELYWETAMPLLEKIRKNQMITYSRNRLFEYKTKEITIPEAMVYIEKGKLFKAVQLMRKKEYEKALQMFEQLKDPYASFYQSQIYKNMADEKMDQNKENVTSEMRSQNIILLSRARDSLYLTLDRLREPSVDKSHPLNVQVGSEIEKMEKLLSRIDPDCNNRNGCEGMSDDIPSSENSVGEHYITTYMNQSSFHNGQQSKIDVHNNHSTPLRLGVARQEARPSPERLDAQIRQMAASRDAALSDIFEQNKTIAESHRCLLEELRSFKDAVNNLTSTVEDLKCMKRGFEEIKDIKKSLDELKHSVGDSQILMDVVQELKKEVNKLKKGRAKPKQLSEEDLYLLDPDYGANVGKFGARAPNLYPNYPQPRMPYPNPSAVYGQAGMYPGFYPGLAYAYGAHGLPQAGRLPFAADPQKPSLAPSVATSYSLPTFAQSPLTLTQSTNVGMGVNMLAGQSLSSQTPLSVLPRTTSGATITSQNTLSAVDPVSSCVSVSRAAPVNVVITSSDPLPSRKTPTTQPILSVTIPPQHIREGVAKVVASDAISKTSTVSTAGAPLFKFAETPTFSPLPNSQTPAHKRDADDEDASNAEEFVPTAEFVPVIALPDLVEVKTGEENSEVLFANRAKLFRYDATGKEWKERGVGVMKVLRDDVIRLLMRRDQIYKVCCNHAVIKNMSFKVNSTNPKAVSWHAQDFSEGVLTPETFTIRFKTEEQASQFLQTLQTAQTSLDENSKVSSKHHKPETRHRTTSFGDEFKPVKGSWECKVCYIVNEGNTNQCLACDTPKSGTSGNKSGESGPGFSFGLKTPEAKPSAGFLFGQKPATNSWGNAFKPVEGSWECKECYIRNSIEQTKCISCETSKEGTFGIANKPTQKGNKLETPGLNVNVGKPLGEPQVTKTDTTIGDSKSVANIGFGDAFKPKLGSWECKGCLIRNDAEVLYCQSCDSPKDDMVPKKEPSKGMNLSTPGQAFTFGVPASSVPQLSSGSNLFSSAGQTSSARVPFGSGSVSDAKPSASIFKPPTSNTFNFKAAPVAQPEESKFVFGSPQKHDFEFKAESPRRVSSGQVEEESDGSYVEDEEDNIYFKPVIALPDKVDVITGEEEENVLYSHRAKLFRFVSGEWKERGLGDIKILKRKDNGKLRVVMRREQVLKICLNHILTNSIDYIPKDERSWMFHTADYSEGEIVHMQFCVKFKTPEIAQEFKKAIADALKGSVSAGGEAPNSTSGNQESDDDVELVSETTVTPEEEQDALRLGLPPKFFSYKQLPDCQCEQCKKDDDYLRDLFGEDKKQVVDSGPDVSLNKSTATTNYGTPNTNLTPSTGGSSYSTPKSNLFTFTPQSQNENSVRFDSLRNFFTKQPLIAASNVSSKLEVSSKSPLSSFPKMTTATTGSLFSKNTIGLPSNANSLFGSPSSGAKNIFGGAVTVISDSTDESINNSCSASSTPAKVSLFGGSTTTNVTTSTVSTAFGGTSSVVDVKTTSSTISSFGSSTNIFGSAKSVVSAAATAPTSSTSLFDGSTSIFGSANKSLFGTTSTTTSNVFGGSAVTTTTTSLFGQNSGMLFGGRNIFSKSAETFTFGTSSFGGIGAKPEVKTGGDSNLNKSTTELNEDNELVLNCDTGLSFASLAATDVKPAFSKTGDNSFSFLGAGAPVFGSAKESTKKKADKSQTESDGDDEGNDSRCDEEYDPHYEPIVPLPDAIVVTTGEENETALFNERAKLFRFDTANKEWKERGVGQFKILHHPQNNTYRFLLRREQVHKVVLNQLIIPTLEIQPLFTSDKAWMWAGYNYTDDDNCLEELAVRFKNTELAQQFYTVVKETIKKMDK